MRPDELAAIRDVAKLQQVAPIVAEEIGGMDRALENRTLMQLQEGTLTPELALQAWMQKAAYRNLLSRFGQRTRVGIAMGELRKQELDFSHKST